MMAAVIEAAVVILLARVVFAPGNGRPRPSRSTSVTVVVAFLVGLVTVRFLRIGERRDPRRRPRWSARTTAATGCATAGGIFIVLAVLVIDAGRSVLGALGVGDGERASPRRGCAVLFAVFGFGLLGMIDDLAAVGEDRGFKGHLGALREGRVTTGLLKLFGGAAVAVVHRRDARVQVGSHAHRRRGAHRARRQPRQPARPRARPHDQVRARRLRADRDRASAPRRSASRSRR